MYIFSCWGPIIDYFLLRIHPLRSAIDIEWYCVIALPSGFLTPFERGFLLFSDQQAPGPMPGYCLTELGRGVRKDF